MKNKPGTTKARKTPGKLRAVLAAVLLREMGRKYPHVADRVSALAADSGVTRSTIQRILAADIGASIDTIEAIAGALDVPTWQFLVPSERGDTPDADHRRGLRAPHEPRGPLRPRKAR